MAKKTRRAAPKYHVIWKPHEADCFGTVKLWKNGSLMASSVMDLADAQELACDLAAKFDDVSRKTMSLSEEYSHA